MSTRIDASQRIRLWSGSFSPRKFSDRLPEANWPGARTIIEKNCCWNANHSRLLEIFLEPLRPPFASSSGFLSPV